MCVAQEQNKFIVKCVNNGIPQRTCSAVDSAVLLFLRKVHCRKLEKQLNLPSQFSYAAVTHVLRDSAHSFKQATACAVEATWKHHVNKWRAYASHIYDTILGDDTGWAYAHSATNSQLIANGSSCAKQFAQRCWTLGLMSLCLVKTWNPA